MAWAVALNEYPSEVVKFAVILNVWFAPDGLVVTGAETVVREGDAVVTGAEVVGDDPLWELPPQAPNTAPADRAANVQTT